MRTLCRLSSSAIAQVLVAALLASSCGAGRAAAVPATTQIREKQREAEAAQAELQRMSDELEVAIEEYNAVSEALAATRARIVEVQKDLESARTDLSERQRKLADRASAIYRSGDGGYLEMLFSTQSFADLVVRIDLLSRIGRHDAQLVSEAVHAKAKVEAIELALHNREQEQAALKQKAERQAADIKRAIQRQERYVAALNAEVKKLIAEEEERQRRLAEERARRAAAAAAARRGSRAATPVGDLPAGRPEVVDIALRYLGVPYVWGGASPAGFDCSGLCMYVYAQIGIDLPRTSAAQFRAGAHIPPDRLDLLRPGDLVFFGTGGDPSRVHHVGIYTGGGDYIHAPQVGDVVKVSSLTERIATRKDYVGASRF